MVSWTSEFQMSSSATTVILSDVPKAFGRALSLWSASLEHPVNKEQVKMIKRKEKNGLRLIN